MSVCHASCLARSAISYLSPSPACACVHTKCRCCLIPARNLVVTHTHTLTYSLTHLSGGVWRAHPFVPYRTNKWHLSIKRIKRVHQKARLYLCAYENLFSLSFMCVCVCVPLPPLWWWFTCRAQHCYAVIKVLIAFAASSSFVMPYNRNYLGLCWNY